MLFEYKFNKYRVRGGRGVLENIERGSQSKKGWEPLVYTNHRNQNQAHLISLIAEANLVDKGGMDNRPSALGYRFSLVFHADHIVC